MTDRFFDGPILNSPYEYPGKHWELDSTGQPTSQILNKRRIAEYITPIPKPKKQRQTQQEMGFDGKGLTTEQQLYDPSAERSVFGNRVRGA